MSGGHLHDYPTSNYKFGEFFRREILASSMKACHSVIAMTMSEADGSGTAAKFLRLRSGSFIAVDRQGRNKMRTSDTDCQGTKIRLQQELKEAHAKKLKLEESIRALDATTKILIEKGALKEIEAYRKRPQPT